MYSPTNKKDGNSSSALCGCSFCRLSSGTSARARLPPSVFVLKVNVGIYTHSPLLPAAPARTSSSGGDLLCATRGSDGSRGVFFSPVGGGGVVGDG